MKRILCFRIDYYGVKLNCKPTAPPTWSPDPYTGLHYALINAMLWIWNSTWTKSSESDFTFFKFGKKSESKGKILKISDSDSRVWCRKGLLFDNLRNNILLGKSDDCECKFLIICRSDRCKIYDSDGNTYVSTCDDDKIVGQARNGFVIEKNHNLGPGTTPVDGPGERFMYVTELSALRFGQVTDSQWDFEAIGPRSFSFGLDTWAVADSSMSFGVCSGLGSLIISSGDGALSFGVAEGPGSNENSGIGATSRGSLAFGVTRGADNVIGTSGQGSAAFGLITRPNSVIENAGSNPSHGSLSFGVINADNSSIRTSNQGSLTFGSINGLPGEINNQILGSGSGALTFGFTQGANAQIESQGFGSLTGGFSLSLGSILGNGTGGLTFGICAGGDITRTTGLGGVTLGQDVRNDNQVSLLLGQFGRSRATSSGSNVIQGLGSLQLAGGVNNTSDNGISVILGTSMFSNTNPIGGGSASFWQTDGALVSVYFEWANGIDLNSDLIGYFVTLRKGKLILANQNDLIVGVTCPDHSGLILDSADLAWSKANMTDDFGRPQVRKNYTQSLINHLNKFLLSKISDKDDISIAFEHHQKLVNGITNMDNDDTIYAKSLTLIKETYPNFCLTDNLEPILEIIENPLYNKDLKYQSRSQRKSWTPVARSGKVCVRARRDVKDTCDCSGGIAVPGNKYHVIERVSEGVVKILL